MAASKINSAVLIVYMLTIQGCYVSSSSSVSLVCLSQSTTFMRDLNLQCPLSISFTAPPIKMDGESLERDLKSSPKSRITSIIFYASWCPFSWEIQSKFGVLSSAFPEIKHIMVEESSIMPSFFSRYGIHSVPSILMVNETERVLYNGQKDLPSLLHFYKRTTGLDPVVDVINLQLSCEWIDHKTIFQPRNHKSFKELSRREPYLVLSMMFLFLKALMYLLPPFVYQVKALWLAHVPHVSLGVLGGSNQLLRRVFDVIYIKEIGKKVTEARNFNKGAQKAREWASSLASVSLGETSLSTAASPVGNL